MCFYLYIFHLVGICHLFSLHAQCYQICCKHRCCPSTRHTSLALIQRNIHGSYILPRMTTCCTRAMLFVCRPLCSSHIHGGTWVEVKSRSPEAFVRSHILCAGWLSTTLVCGLLGALRFMPVSCECIVFNVLFGVCWLFLFRCLRLCKWHSNTLLWALHVVRGFYEWKSVCVSVCVVSFFLLFCERV